MMHSSALTAAYKKAPINLWVEDYATRVYLTTIWRSDRTEPNDCPNFVDQCP